MPYKVDEAGSAAALERAVNEAEEEGWKPQGGVAALAWKQELPREGSVTNFGLFQALVKES